MALVTTTNGRMSIDCTDSGDRYAEDCANARLVSKAPEMFDLLLEITADLGHAEWSGPEHAQEILTALIEKYWKPGKALLKAATE